jgi:glycerate 2-kinase
LLLSSGAEINEINVVRKHLSQIKGGKLGQKFSPATVISLILSDVIGNDLSVIASGPTVPDPSTFAEAYQILEKYHLVSKISDEVRVFLQKGCQGLVAETPKVLSNCHNYIIGDNTLALEAMAQKAARLGCRPCIITAEQKGDTAIVAQLRARQVMKAGTDKYNVILLGGETTLKVPESAGLGGRNQHYAAVTLLAMQDFSKKWVMASVGTDGSDYLPDVAGAIVDHNSSGVLSDMNINPQRYISNCDSNTLLDKLGDSLIMTGNTGTNVGDVVVYLIK